MHGPDGVDYNNQIVYEEIVNQEKLVYAHGSGGDADDAFHVVVTFDEQDGGTVLNMTTAFRTAAELEQAIREYGAVEGAKSTLDRLEAHLATM